MVLGYKLMATYYGCPGCISNNGTHICGLTSGGNVLYNNVTWTSTATGGFASNVTGGSCSICGSPLGSCTCLKKYTWLPNAINPINPPNTAIGSPCSSCGQYWCQGQCMWNQTVPYYPYSPTPNTIGTTTWTVISNVIDWLHDIKLFDLQTEELVKVHDSLLTILARTPENGFLGTLEYIKLPSIFQNYFLKVGKDESAMDIWYMISPMVFRLLSQDKDKKETSHMVVILGVKNLELEETKEETIVHLKKVRLLEIKDNLSLIQLAERDVAFRRHLLK